MAVEKNTTGGPVWDTTTTPAPTATPQPTAPEQASEPPRGGGRGWLGWLLAALIIGGLVWVKFHYFPAPAGDKGGKGGGKGSPGGSAEKGAKGSKSGSGGSKGKTPVGVFVVKATQLSDDVTSTGSVLAEQAVTIRSELSGRITSLNFKEGQRVSKGQLLFTINADETQAALQKQAFNIKLYEDQERRQRTLLGKEYISQQEYEQSNNQLLTARADQQALRATLLKANVRAPFAGTLGLSSTTVGTYVSPGVAIVTLAQTRPVKIEFGVPGRFAAQVRVGSLVRVSDEASARQFTAKIYALNPQLDPVSRTLQARARFANAGDELQPGAFVKVALQLSQMNDALQIPTEAVVPVASGYQVFVVQKGKVAVKDIKIGLRSDALIQVLSGLAVGDSVVRTGVLQIKAGDFVLINN